MPLLYLLRHGIAEMHGADPSLSAEGVRLMRLEARGMKSLGMRPARIVSSPLARAVETAEILQEILEAPEKAAVADELGPGLDPTSLTTILKKRRTEGDLLLVGHQPDLGMLAGRLIGSRTPIPFERGSVCGLELNDWDALESGRVARLVTLLPPGALVALGQGGER